MNQNAIHTLNMSRIEWLQERTKGLGGSDAGVVLGLNKYKTAFELWLEKTGQVEPQEIDSEAIYWGNEMLEEIRGLYPLRNVGYQVSEIRKIVIKALEVTEK